METTHSSVGASSCERWWNCPGSVKLVSTLPPQEPSEYAKEGTKLHAVAAYALQNHMTAASAAEMMINSGRFLDVMAGGIDFDQCDAVQVCIDTVREDLVKYRGAQLEIEKQFQLTSIHPDARGTNDANIGVFLKKLIVYDYKFGRGVSVEVEENKQMMYYGLGANQEGDYDEIELVVIQPRAIHRDGPIRRWVLHKSELLAFGEQLKAHISATSSPTAPLVCGDHCQKYFCPALAVCPAVKQRVGEVAVGVFDEPVRTLPAPETLNSNALKKLLDTIPIIDAYTKSVEAYALSVLNNGGKVEGYKLVQKKSNRQWKDEEVVKKKWPKIAVQTVEKVLSPAQVEKSLAEVMTKKEAVKIVEDFCFKPDAGVTLAVSEDPREEVRPKLESVFQPMSEKMKDDSIFS